MLEISKLNMKSHLHQPDCISNFGVYLPHKQNVQLLGQIINGQWKVDALQQHGMQLMKYE